MCIIIACYWMYTKKIGHSKTVPRRSDSIGWSDGTCFFEIFALIFTCCQIQVDVYNPGLIDFCRHNRI